MALLNLFKFLSPFIPQTKIESAKVNEQFSKIGDSMDTIAATLDRTPVYAAGTTFPSAANAGKAMVLDASGNPTFRAIGSAADLTATTSDTDSTAGRALRVGNLGFGSQIAGIKEVYTSQVPSAVLSIVGGSAHYMGSILNHGASAPEAWGVINGYITNSNAYSYSYQEFTGIYGARYRRTASSASAWNAWRKVYEEGDLGSASLLVSSAGVDDTTIGRAARIGDHGLGLDGNGMTRITAVVDYSGSVDFNTVTAPGWHRVLANGPISTNAPPVGGIATGYWTIHVLKYATSQLQQYAYTYLIGATDPHLVYVRGRYAGVWTPWQQAMMPPVGTVAYDAVIGRSVGAVLEYGTNSNGSYLKFADGSVKAWGRVIQTGLAINPAGRGNHSTGHFCDPVMPTTMVDSVFTVGQHALYAADTALLYSLLITSTAGLPTIVNLGTSPNNVWPRLDEIGVFVATKVDYRWTAIGRWR